VDKNKTFSDWVNLYTQDLVKWAIQRVSDRDLAKDLVQETFLAAFEQMEKFKGKSSPKTWLTGILKFKIADHFRMSYARPTFSLPENAFFDAEENWKSAQIPQDFHLDEPAQLFNNVKFQSVFEDCLSKLSSVWHAAIKSKYLDEKDAQIICQELGISLTNYWQMVHRARLNLRKCLEINWFKK
jgi:RNA polymerase sigma-70 factor (TIGR02943 family)